MPPGQTREPKILVPYPGPQNSPDILDIFVYMRPETNGVIGESAIMKVIGNCPEYKVDLNMIYLANIPGDYIVRNHIVEKHYAVKFHFAVHGKNAFTSFMRERFNEYFDRSVDEAPVIGSFEALRRLHLSAEELFSFWVEPEKILNVDGQTIKLVEGVYVVNYDIPALLHRNSRNTDIAVMLFRTTLTYEYFSGLVEKMREAMISLGLLSPVVPIARAFHYSKNPFEQLIDGLGYLCKPDGGAASLSDLSFAVYLDSQGTENDTVLDTLSHPIARFHAEDGTEYEDNLLTCTYHNSFSESLEQLRRVRYHYPLDPS